jgi:hypothetical protein
LLLLFRIHTLISTPPQDVLQSIRDLGGAYPATLAALAAAKPPKVKFSDGVSLLLRIQEPQLDGIIDVTRVSRLRISEGLFCDMLSLSLLCVARARTTTAACLIAWSHGFVVTQPKLQRYALC